MTSTEHDIGSTAEFSIGSIRRVELNGRAYAIARNDQGFFAVRDTCPHQGARLSSGTLTGNTVSCKVGDVVYRQNKEVIQCPWHGWDFDLKSGNSVFDEAQRVATADVKVKAGRILVTT